jgi:glutamate-1-semialdehyde 2,1-aminomutase
MSAIRLARAFTERSIIVKFEGCYHGHVDALLIQAGSGALTHGRPTSAGIPTESTALTRGLPFNDLDAFTKLMDEIGDSVAAVIVEPVPGNMGVVPPKLGFLAALRSETTRHGALLIFDEVITGFRVGLAGVQGRENIVPDLTSLGKIIGGGLPAAAFGGRAEIMDMLSPTGPVYQAGTLSGNPVAMEAGLAQLELLKEADYGYLESLATNLTEGLTQAAADAGVELTVNRYGSMLSPFFQIGPVTDLESAKTSDTGRYGNFFHAMLDRGVYLPPSQFETWMLSFAHTPETIESIAAVASESLLAVR